MARPRTDIRPRLLAAARARFLAESVDGASLRAIAKDAATSIGMVYYYFPTKEDLFLGVVEEVYAKVLGDLEQIFEDPEHTTYVDRVRALYRRIAHMNGIEADTFRLIIREALSSSDRLARLVERFKTGHVALLFRLVADGRRDGSLTSELPMPLMAIVTGVIGAAPQVILRALGSNTPFGALAAGDALVDLQLRVLMGGIGASPAPAPAPAPRTRKPRAKPR
jgi:AcrR family transcriptional regulator